MHPLESGNKGRALTDGAVPDVDQHVGVGAVATDRHVVLRAPEVVVDGLLLGAARDHVVVELAPAPVPPGVDEHHVVAPVVVPGVH